MLLDAPAAWTPLVQFRIAFHGRKNHCLHLSDFQDSALNPKFIVLWFLIRYRPFARLTLRAGPSLRPEVWNPPQVGACYPALQNSNAGDREDWFVPTTKIGKLAMDALMLWCWPRLARITSSLKEFLDAIIINYQLNRSLFP
jgi:hypothetical protein